MLRTSLLASVALTPFMFVPALAQDAFALDEIIVSGSLSPVAEGQTGATVEVLQSDDIATSDTSLINRLDRLPGVSSSANGGVGSSTTIRIRGLGPQYVGVRLDGIDITDPASLRPEFNFGGLLSSGLGRVEVLKGSQSALYGSEAIAGVVNITSFTPEADGFSGLVSLETGSYGTNTGSTSVGYRGERGFVALSYGTFATDGFSSRTQDGPDPDVTEDDGFSQSTVNVTGEYALTDSLSVGTALFYRDGSVDYDLSRADPIGFINSEEQGVRLYATWVFDGVTNTFSYSYFDNNRDVQTRPFVPSVPALNRPLAIENYRGTRRNLSYLATADLNGSMVLNLGADYTEEDYDSTTGSRIVATEDNTSINAELLYSPSGDVDISTALRYDDNSSFGGKVTGRLAGVWRPSDDLAVRGVIGTGFRAPSLNERFGPFGANPDLEPEESLSLELGVEQTFARGFIKATVFQTEIDNLIDYVSAYVQVPRTSTSRGVEVSGEYALSGTMNLFGNYTYTDARDDENARLTRVPLHDLVLGVDSDFTDRFSGTMDVRFVADALASRFAPADNKVGTYTVVGAGLSYDMNDMTQAYLRVENLFDEDYETAGGYNTPGRSAFFGIRAEF